MKLSTQKCLNVAIVSFLASASASILMSLPAIAQTTLEETTGDTQSEVLDTESQSDSMATPPDTSADTINAAPPTDDADELDADDVETDELDADELEGDELEGDLPGEATETNDTLETVPPVNELESEMDSDLDESELDASELDSERPEAVTDEPMMPGPDTMPEDTMSEDSTLDESMPTESMPTESMPTESDMPEPETTDAEVMPDAVVPSTPIPGTPMPGTPMPGTTVPNGEVPDSEMPDAAVPGADTPHSAMPDTEMPETEMPEAEALPDEALPSETKADSPTAVSGSLAAIAASNESLSTFAAVVEAAGLTDVFAEEGPITVFAPSNEAFEALPEGMLEQLLSNPQTLTRILAFHVIEGGVTSEQIESGSVMTAEGTPVTVDAQPDDITVNGASVVEADLEAENGVIHVIDEVILPPNI